MFRLGCWWILPTGVWRLPCWHSTFPTIIQANFSATLHQPTKVGAGLAATTHRMGAVCAMMMMAKCTKKDGRQNHGQRGLLPRSDGIPELIPYDFHNFFVTKIPVFTHVLRPWRPWSKPTNPTKRIRTEGTIEPIEPFMSSSHFHWSCQDMPRLGGQVSC